MSSIFWWILTVSSFLFKSGFQKTMETVKRSVLTRRRGWWTEHREFLGPWNYSVSYDDCGIHAIIHLLKPTECTTPRVNLSVNYGLWAIMTCQCRGTDGGKCTTLVGTLIMRRGQECMENLWTRLSVLLWIENCSKK